MRMRLRCPSPGLVSRDKVPAEVPRHLTDVFVAINVQVYLHAPIASSQSRQLH